MNLPVPGELLRYAIAAIFGAGVCYAKIKSHEKSLNGLGRKATKSLVAQIAECEKKEDRWRLVHFFFG